MLQTETSTMARTPGRSMSDNRKARLAEALRTNLRKRKAQARARAAGGDDQPAGSGEATVPDAGQTSKRE
jgi:hypothetical protein